MSVDGFDSAPPQAVPAQGTRDLILDEADQFLMTHPFRDLTVSGLMQATSVSRPAFYQYFRDRYDIAAALIDRIGAAAQATGGAWMNGETEPVEGCDAGVRALVRNISPHAYVIRAICDAAAADDRIDNLWRRGFVQRYVEGVSRRVRMDQASGIIPPEVDADLIARALVLTTQAFICDCLGKPECGDDQGFADTLSRVWCGTLYGVY